MLPLLVLLLLLLLLQNPQALAECFCCRPIARSLIFLIVLVRLSEHPLFSSAVDVALTTLPSDADSSSSLLAA